MKRLVTILILFCLCGILAAQDLPVPRPVTQERILAEVGRLQVQLSTREDYIEELRVRITQLQAENAELRKKVPAEH